jgi:hypothetical protein
MSRKAYFTQTDFTSHWIPDSASSTLTQSGFTRYGDSTSLLLVLAALLDAHGCVLSTFLKLRLIGWVHPEGVSRKFQSLLGISKSTWEEAGQDRVLDPGGFPWLGMKSQKKKKKKNNLITYLKFLILI